MRVLTGGTSTKSGLSRGHYVSRARKTGLQLYTQGVATCDIMYLGPDEMTLGTDVMELCPPSGLTTVCEPMTLTDDVMTLGGDPMTLCTTGIRECGHIVLGSGNPLVLTSEATDGVLTFCGIAPSYEAVDPSTLTYYGDECIIDGAITIDGCPITINGATLSIDQPDSTDTTDTTLPSITIDGCPITIDGCRLTIDNERARLNISGTPINIDGTPITI